MKDLSKSSRVPDPWITLQRHTSARIALGRAGVSVPSNALLDFKLAHAHARDAVYSTLDYDTLTAALKKMGLETINLRSQATTRQEYLQRPDLGRKLSEASKDLLTSAASENQTRLSVIVADGLSAEAVNDHVLSLIGLLLARFRESGITLAPFALVDQGRVAISDEVGFLLRSEMALILIGERPGLTSPNSLGAYLTYSPRPGLTDESRNCISNIRPEGLPYGEAADKLFYLIREALRRKVSGVSLKDNAGLLG